MLNKNTYNAKKGEANQKQQLSGYTYIATYTDNQNSDISEGQDLTMRL